MSWPSTAPGRHPRAVSRIRSRGRDAVADRGEHPSRQGTGRPRRTSAAPLDLLAPLDRPGHARARRPRHHRSRRTRPRHHHTRADPIDLQQDPPPVHQPAKPRQTWHPSPAALVTMATTTPSPRPHQPPPPPSSHTATITIYGCSIKFRSTVACRSTKERACSTTSDRTPRAPTSRPSAGDTRYVGLDNVRRYLSRTTPAMMGAPEK